MSKHEKVLNWCQLARKASRLIGRASTREKNMALHSCADLLRRQQDDIVAANAQDLEAAQKNAMAAAMLDRLKLDREGIEEMAQACEFIAKLDDPVGQIDRIVQRPSGIRVGRMRVPLGTVLIIYESRPNVTIEAAALSFKAGNACILRGGKEAIHSNNCLAKIARQAFASVSSDVVQFVDDPDRELLYALLKQQDSIELVIPRGGPSLIQAVMQQSRIPVVQHYQGICHVYVDAQADLKMAENILRNSKMQRPGVCNAAEALIVHSAVAKKWLPELCQRLDADDVEMRGDARTCNLSQHVKKARDEDFDSEFLSLVLAIKVVDSLDEAMDFIAAHGSRHTETIVSNDHAATQRFLREVDASCVMINASTRFNDGAQLGLGAEIGISTTKVHAYGPMGLEGLTCQKFVVYGSGEIRD